MKIRSNVRAGTTAITRRDPSDRCGGSTRCGGTTRCGGSVYY